MDPMILGKIIDWPLCYPLAELQALENHLLSGVKNGVDTSSLFHLFNHGYKRERLAITKDHQRASANNTETQQEPAKERANNQRMTSSELAENDQQRTGRERSSEQSNQHPSERAAPRNTEQNNHQ